MIERDRDRGGNTGDTYYYTKRYTRKYFKNGYLVYYDNRQFVL